MSLVRSGGMLVFVVVFFGFATAGACAGPTASLVFSNPSRLYTAGPLVVTATFSADITPTAPAITISGVTGGVSVAGVEMTATSTLTVWTYTTTIQNEDTPGTHAVTLGAL